MDDTRQPREGPRSPRGGEVRGMAPRPATTSIAPTQKAPHGRAKGPADRRKPVVVMRLHPKVTVGRPRPCRPAGARDSVAPIRRTRTTSETGELRAGTGERRVPPIATAGRVGDGSGPGGATPARAALREATTAGAAAALAVTPAPVGRAPLPRPLIAAVIRGARVAMAVNAVAAMARTRGAALRPSGAGGSRPVPARVAEPPRTLPSVRVNAPVGAAVVAA